MTDQQIQILVNECGTYLVGLGKRVPPHVLERLLSNIKTTIQRNDEDEEYMMDPIIAAVYGNKFGNTPLRRRSQLSRFGWCLMVPQLPVLRTEEAQRMVKEINHYKGRWAYHESFGPKYSLPIIKGFFNKRNEVFMECGNVIVPYSKEVLKNSLRLDRRIQNGVFIRAKTVNGIVCGQVLGVWRTGYIEFSNFKSAFASKVCAPKDIINFPHRCKAQQRLLGVKI